MGKKEIIERNKLIAEFMNLEYDGYWQAKTHGREDITVHELRLDGLSYEYHHIDDNGDKETDLPFHQLWEWLMPVIDTIETMGIDNVGEPYCVIMPYQFEVREGNNVILHTRKTTTKINMVWKGVVEFIKWYNTQKS
jgi:hypothetical protein